MYPDSESESRSLSSKRDGGTLHVDPLWAENRLCDFLIMGCPLVAGTGIRLCDTSSKPVSCLRSAASNQREGKQCEGICASKWRENALNRKAQYDERK